MGSGKYPITEGISQHKKKPLFQFLSFKNILVACIEFEMESLWFDMRPVFANNDNNNHHHKAALGNSIRSHLRESQV